MKKKLIIIGIIFIIFMLIGLYCFNNDKLRFKMSYEFANSYEYSGGKKIKVSIPFDNKINYLNKKELLKFIESGTGILYFGYNTCPWCRNAVPILIDAAIENNLDTIYYVDIHSVKIDSIKDEFYSVFEEYLSSDDEGKKRLAVPDVYAFKNGKILGNHLGTIESYKNPYNGMTDKQKQELKDIYAALIKEVK